MENSAGGLVAEIPSHGLTGIPGVLTSLGQVPIEDYSNNVGFYKQAFYVHTESSALPQASPPQALNKASAQVQTIARGSSKSPDFRLEKKPLPSNLVAPGKSIEIRAKLLAGQESDPAVTVVFFDGDPNNGGTAFDAETAPYLKARDEYEVSVPFESEACGDHQIFVVAGAGTTSEQTLKYDITVKCDSAKMKWLN